MKFKKIIAVISASSLVLSGCSTPQSEFEKYFDLANESYLSGDLKMAEAYISDAFTALPEGTEAGRELNKRINDSIFSDSVLQEVKEAKAQGDWQKAVEFALKLGSVHPHEGDANALARQSTLEFLEEVAALTSIDSDQADAIQQSLVQMASDDVAEIGIDNSALQLAVDVLGKTQSSRLNVLVNEKQFESAVSLAIDMEATGLYSSGPAIASIESAKTIYESEIIRQSKRYTAEKKLAPANKLVSDALAKLPTSTILASEATRISGLIRQDQERQRKQAEEERQRAVRAMYVKEDTFEGIKWYYDRATYSQYAGNKFLFYMGQRGSSRPWLRLRFMLYMDSWHFFESIKIDVDGNQYSFYPGYSGVKRDNGSGNVWEWYDHDPSSADIRMIEAIINSKNTRIRYINDENFYVERTVSSAQKKAFSRVLLAFEALGGNRQAP